MDFSRAAFFIVVGIVYFRLWDYYGWPSTETVETVLIDVDDNVCESDNYICQCNIKGDLGVGGLAHGIGGSSIPDGLAWHQPAEARSNRGW